MSYAYDWDDGQQLAVENDGGRTLVCLSSRGEGQQQSQTVGFDTGRWSTPPLLFRMHRDLILRVEGEADPQFFLVRAGTVRPLDSEPDLSHAERLTLHPAERPVAVRSMKPMEPLSPLKPMEPMKPFQPMKPLEPLTPLKPMEPTERLEPLPPAKSIGPLEMRMGDMQMSMGSGKPGEERAPRFCTQCGEPVQDGDRFCGQCGKPLRIGK